MQVEDQFKNQTCNAEHAGHPEFSTEFMEALVRWKAKATPDSFPPALADGALRELHADPVTAKDAAAWHHLCKAFLRGPDLNGTA